jgi:hypothetical protein
MIENFFGRKSQKYLKISRATSKSEAINNEETMKALNPSDALLARRIAVDAFEGNTEEVDIAKAIAADRRLRETRNDAAIKKEAARWCLQWRSKGVKKPSSLTDDRLDVDDAPIEPEDPEVPIDPSEPQ